MGKKVCLILQQTFLKVLLVHVYQLIKGGYYAVNILTDGKYRSVELLLGLLSVIIFKERYIKLQTYISIDQD